MKKIIFLIGPTAVGKTEASFYLARQFPVEIVSADSMQVYRRMNIGTAKPSTEECRRVPHHLIDILDPTEECSVYDYRQKALEAFDAILRRKKIPLVVGGSGLYIKALTDGLAPQPAANDSIREKFQKILETKGEVTLHALLSKCDPLSAAKLKPTDTRRVIRALEVFEISKTSLQEWNKKTVSLESLGFSFLMLGLNRERAALYRRVEERVEMMIAQGLEAEVKALATLPLSKTTLQAVGYKEFFSYFRGEISRDEAIDTIKKNTRHLVKKQNTWFRKEKRIEWFSLGEQLSDEDVFELFAKRTKNWLGNR